MTYLPQQQRKYLNKKTIVDGISFDSKKEARRYQELKQLQQSGAITALRLQPVYELQPKFKCNGKTERAITYKADFEYIEDGKTIVEDTKGMLTEVFKIKRKLFLCRYPEYELRLT